MKDLTDDLKAINYYAEVDIFLTQPFTMPLKQLEKLCLSTLSE